jgi:hypothetical protein
MENCPHCDYDPGAESAAPASQVIVAHVWFSHLSLSYGPVTGARLCWCGTKLNHFHEFYPHVEAKGGFFAHFLASRLLEGEDA